jgi:phosphatidylserine/phosphatidylglycerophosphate/cardiolipin synthase-like enzyme
MTAARLLAALFVFAAPLPAGAAGGAAPATVSTCFSPGPASCADMIAGAIDAAHAEVRVQAYWLTSVPILRALSAAQRSGVDVATILDKTGWNNHPYENVR